MQRRRVNGGGREGWQGRVLLRLLLLLWWWLLVLKRVTRRRLGIDVVQREGRVRRSGRRVKIRIGSERVDMPVRGVGGGGEVEQHAIDGVGVDVGVVVIEGVEASEDGAVARGRWAVRHE